MKAHSLLTTTAAALMMAGAAFAQTDTTQETGSNENPPATPETSTASDTMTGTNNWSQSVNSTFFTDDSMATLRTEEEIRTGWASLSEEDKEMVRQRCMTQGTEGAAVSAEGTGASTENTGADGVSNVDQGSDGNLSDSEGGTNTGASAAGGEAGDDSAMVPAISPENMTTLCGYVQASN